MTCVTIPMMSPPFGLSLPMFLPPAHSMIPRDLGLAPAPVLLLGVGLGSVLGVVSWIRLVVVDSDVVAVVVVVIVAVVVGCGDVVSDESLRARLSASKSIPLSLSVFLCPSIVSHDART